MLSSCTSRDYIDGPKAIYQSVKGVDYEITDAVIDSKEFSFIKVNIGRSIVATMTLFDINNGTYEWISSDADQRIYTKQGKIIKTIGLEHDIEILANSHFSLNSTNDSGKYFVRLHNPIGMFTQTFDRKKSEILDYNRSWLHNFNYGFKEFKFRNKPKFVIEERFRTAVYRWAGKNTYWVDENLNVIKSTQTIHPYLPKITINYFYKY